MEELKEAPKGFTEHGVRFVGISNNNFHGICPFCGKDKFFANKENLLWDCKSCIISGNFQKFLEKMQALYAEYLKGKTLLDLANNRKLKPQTFSAWGIGFSPFTGEYMIPQNGNGNRLIGDIHRYRIGKKAYGTSGGKHQLIAPLVQHDSKRVWICEGEWDGLALYELFKTLNIQETIYASPGAGTFPQKLAGLFTDKDVCILNDNDTPGQKGAVRTGNILSGHATSINYLRWNPELGFKDGYDIRDLYTDSENAQEVFEFICDNLTTEPPTILADGSVSAVPAPVEEVTGDGLDPEEVTRRYREWLHIRDDEVLNVIYGTAFANRLNVDPLWMFIVGPPGSSKTELLMSLSDAPKIATTTSLTPPALISGAQNSGKDPSMIPKLNGKTLIIKDFTTILNMNITARDEIFGILRDVYDGKIEKHFGNGVSRKYASKFGILAGVTPAIEGISTQSSVLGERFIKYKIKHVGKINVGGDVIQRALLNLNKESGMRTALKTIGNEVLKRTIDPANAAQITPEIALQLQYLGQLVASLRGAVSKDRYSGLINFKPCAEIGTRLAKQFGALAMGISMFRMEENITEKTMQIVCSVAQDTVPDRVEEIVKQMYKNTGADDYFLSTQEICNLTKFPTTTIQSLLADLTMLHVIQKDPQRFGLWRLAASVIRLIKLSRIYG